MLTILGCESDDDDEDDRSIPSITPRSVNIASGAVDSVTFEVRGGTPGYAWSLTSTALGTLALVEFDEAVYTSTGASGQNFVTVTDARSNAVSATITQN